ncbi:MAG: DMP19 family protein [Bacteroidaceae bacterium]|nr:DMP19 family protein [Bacteroidaceae bacterium]
MEELTVFLAETELREAAQKGEAAFLDLITDAVAEAAGGTLDADALRRLNADQVTLLALRILREEVSVGGFVQLIHNGYGPFFFDNPFAKALRQWGLRDLSQMVYSAARLYRRHGDDLTREMDDDAFMALYEAHPDFDPLDDEFVDREDEYVEQAARYVDHHLQDFVTVV